MARIRSIKPEFWTSPQIVECSTNARLLFIGLWNFCDDSGVTPASPLQIKMRIFPGDPFSIDDVTGWINELLSADLLCHFENNNKEYYAVTGWALHQKIDRPNPRHPIPTDKDSTIIRGTFVDHSSKPPPRKGGEGKGEEGNGENPTPTAAPPPCPHQEIIALYHEMLPQLPRIIEATWMDSKDSKHLRSRWLAHPDHQNLDFWKGFFLTVRNNPFWMGENDRAWKANLRWLVNKTNFTKVVERWANS